jgi:hypothetical protein
MNDSIYLSLRSAVADAILVRALGHFFILHWLISHIKAMALLRGMGKVMEDNLLPVSLLCL